MNKADIKNDPSGIHMEPFPADLVFAVDRIVDMAHGSSGAVQTYADLKVVRSIFNLFVKYYPKAAQDLYKSVAYFKRTEKENGINKEGSAMIQHQIEIPQRFYELMNAVYPNQKWDTRFVRKIAEIIPEVKATKGGI